MKLIWGILLVVATAALQVSFFGSLRPLGVVPNLMVITVVFISLWGNASFSVSIAIVGGVLLDMASGSDFGLRTAFFVVTSLGIIAGRQLGLQIDSWLSALALVALATLLYDMASFATLKTGISPLVISRISSNVGITTFLALVAFSARLLIQSQRSAVQKKLRDAQ